MVCMVKVSMDTNFIPFLYPEINWEGLFLHFKAPLNADQWLFHKADQSQDITSPLVHIYFMPVAFHFIHSGLSLR